MLLSRSLKLAVLGPVTLAGAVIAPVFLGGCDRQSSEKAQPQPAKNTGAEVLAGTIDRSHRGSLLPDFTLSDASGRQLRLRTLKGKPLLLNLWATWCGPCVVEMPMLEKLATERDGALRVLTVSQDMGQTDKVATFMTRHGFKRLEPWLDPENDLSFHYGTGTLPTTVYYDAQGREIWRFVGGHDWTNAETARMLAEGSPQ